MAKDGFLFARSLAGFVPVDDRSTDEMAKTAIGDVVFINISKPRNGKRHRLYWALISLVHRTLDDRKGYPTTQHLSDAVKIAMGYFDTIIVPGGGEWQRPQSISYGKMTEDEFGAFLDKTITLIRERLLPKVTDEELRARLEEMVG